jgi:hypothetical protein
MLHRLKVFPFHVFGIIIFFITHGYSEYPGLIPITDLFVLLGILSLSGALLLGFFVWRLRSAVKAGLLVIFLLAFYLFYGAIQDAFKCFSLNSLSRYRYTIPAFVLVFLALFIYLKRSASDFKKITLYLNTIFAVFIVYDLVIITKNALAGEHTIAKTDKVDRANYGGQFDKRPDIYFVLLDEYSGTSMLKTYYNYNNQPFENSLRQQGFFVAAAPACNYQATVLSMASLFSMDYLKWLPAERKEKETAADFAKAYELIGHNEVTSFLQANGYEINNYSIFDISNKPSFFVTGLFSVKLQLITGKTLASCIEKDLEWNFRKKGEGENWFTLRLKSQVKKNNQRVIDAMKAAPAQHTTHPRFVYAHLLMPHEPFLYDSTGHELHVNMYNLSVPADVRKKAYLQYLVYTTKVVNAFIRELLQKTNGKAVIVLMSDHGYRGLIENGKKAPAHNNFNAVYLPNKDYRLFYDSISNVNQFRVLFNTIFKTQFPLLPDIK